MSDIDLDGALYRVLRYGVVLSALVLALGMAALYAEPASPLGDGLLVAGIFVLFATPVLRVVVSAAAFILEGNRVYAVITIIVLADIMFAILVMPGLIGH